jgi:hypothetical protein
VTRKMGIRWHLRLRMAEKGLALTAELPAAVLADLTGTSVSSAERWSQWAKRDWAAYVGERALGDRQEPPAGNLLNKPPKHTNRN